MRIARALTLLVVGSTLAVPAAAYNGYGQGDEGFFIFLDAMLATPGNTDEVIAYSNDWAGSTQTVTPLSMDWGSSPAGRLGFGYRWGDSSISISYWGFSDDETLRADGPAGGEMHWAIGPATYYYVPGYYVGPYYYPPINVPGFEFGTPGHADFKAEIEAATIDIDFEHAVGVGDFFDLEWSVGLRYATFEEKIEGVYDLCAASGCTEYYSSYPEFRFGEVQFDAKKSNESDMFGVKAGIGGTYFATDSFAVSSQISLSALTGTLESRSGLTPTGTFNASLDRPTLAVREDDSRTGLIAEIDVGIRWYLSNDKLRLMLGYHYSQWDGIGADLLRNTPGLLTPNKDRENITFSGPYLGVRFDF